MTTATSVASMTTETAAGISADHIGGEPTTATEDLLTEELLVEEISIDGMCGVY